MMVNAFRSRVGACPTVYRPKGGQAVGTSAKLPAGDV